MSFYERTPSTNAELLRHGLLMFVLLRKLRYMLIRGSHLPTDEQNLEKLYNSRMSSEASSYRPGQHYDIGGRKIYPCNIANDRVLIPRYSHGSLSYIIEDELNFVLAVEDSASLKIVVNLKYKFINPVVDRRDISTIVIKIRGYDASKQEFVNKDDLLLRCNDQYVSQKVVAQLITRRDLCRQAELSFISKLLTNSEKDLPQANLL